MNYRTFFALLAFAFTTVLLLTLNIVPAFAAEEPGGALLPR